MPVKGGPGGVRLSYRSSPSAQAQRRPGRFLLGEALDVRSSVFPGVRTFAESKILELVQTLFSDSAFPILLVKSPGSHGRILRKRRA